MADPLHFEELVLAHIDAENAKDADRVRATYGAEPSLVDVPSGHTLSGWEAMMAFYHARWRAFPQAQRTVTRLMSTEDGTYAEVEIRGRQDGPLQGLAPSGKETVVRACSFFEADAAGLIGQQTLYYDALGILVQLGVLPDLESPLGRAWLGMHRPSLLFKTLADKLKVG